MGHTDRGAVQINEVLSARTRWSAWLLWSHSRQCHKQVAADAWIRDDQLRDRQHDGVLELTSPKLSAGLCKQR